MVQTSYKNYYFIIRIKFYFFPVLINVYKLSSCDEPKLLNRSLILHDDIILLLRPKSFRGFLSCVNQTFCYLNLAEAAKFEYERKNEEDSGRSSKMTPLCKWPIKMPFTSQALRSLLFHMQNISCGGSGKFLDSFWVLK